MANFSISSSSFKPFSYAEMLAPVMQATLAHLKLEEDLGNLSTLAAVLKERALKSPNENWAKKYLSYAERLEKQADILNLRGLTLDARRLFLASKRDYVSDVETPLKAIELQLKLSDIEAAADPSLRIIWGKMPTVDELIADMSTKPVRYSGRDIYNAAATSSKAATSRNYVTKYFKDNTNLPGYIQELKTRGYTTNQIQELLLDKDSFLLKIVADTKLLFGNFEGLDPAQQKILEKEIFKGLLDGAVYEENKNLIYNLHEAQQLAFKHDIEMEDKKLDFLEKMNKIVYNQNKELKALDQENAERLAKINNDYQMNLFKAQNEAAKEATKVAWEHEKEKLDKEINARKEAAKAAAKAQLDALKAQGDNLIRVYNETTGKALQAQATASKEGDGNNYLGLLTNELSIRYGKNGKESALQMKNNFAEHTYNYLVWASKHSTANNRKKESAAILKKFKTKKALIDHLKKYGFSNISGLSTDLQYGVKSSLRKNVTGDEALLSIWIEAPGTISMPGSPTMPGRLISNVKQWKSWDSRSGQAYRMDIPFVNMSDSDTQSILKGRTIRYKEIVGVDENGNYKYGKSVIPKTREGKWDLDGARIGLLSNGDYCIYDTSGKVLWGIPAESLGKNFSTLKTQLLDLEKSKTKKKGWNKTDLADYDKKLRSILGDRALALTSLAGGVKPTPITINSMGYTNLTEPISPYSSLMTYGLDSSNAFANLYGLEPY